MHIRPILSTLARHKTAAALIIIEVAISCANLCNALFIVSQRLSAITQPSGMDDKHLVILRASGIGQVDQALARTQEDLAALRAIPGVSSATIVNQLPFQGSAWNTSISTAPNGEGTMVNAAQYNLAPGSLQTLGLPLVAGREQGNEDFYTPEEIGQRMQSGEGLQLSLMISQELADKLFPEGNAVGKSLYMGPYPLTVIGVTGTLKRPNSSFGAMEYSLMMPVHISYADGGMYVLRVDDPALRDEVMQAANEVLIKRDPNRLVRPPQTFEEQRNKYFSADRDMVGLLIVVSLLLLLVTALGIVGLASFWVGQRTKQIGIRRALGATRGQILQYFLTENALLVGGGIVLGMLMTYGLNQWLMGTYALPRLPLYYLPVGAAVLWLLGLASVYGPARRASMIPPAVAARST